MARRAIVLCMGGMVIISAIQLAMAIYLLVNGMRDALLIATESFMIYAVSQALGWNKINDTDQMDDQVKHQSGLSRPAFALLSTVSSSCSGQLTARQPKQNYFTHSPRAYCYPMDDCLSALSHHRHPGFRQ